MEAADRGFELYTLRILKITFWKSVRSIPAFQSRYASHEEIEVPGSRPTGNFETFTTYVRQGLIDALAMSFAAGGCWKPHLRS